MKIDSQSEIGYTSRYLTVNGKPWFPVMGEMHYSRYPEQFWEKELYKMKAGGIGIVSMYVIWIHHEESEGTYDFTGQRNLRKFLELIQGCGMQAILRIGPWVHAEVRNGGFPDWLLEKAGQEQFGLRSNAPQYLACVRKFWDQIYEQSEGLLLKDGGPVIGLQIENEYGHVNSPGGENGEQHMRTLLQMAKKAGFEVPLYTATGWGGAVTGGMLPVMGGYCEAPWDPRIVEIEPSGNYIFTMERNDHNIGSDHGIGEGITFDMNRFPYLTAELGGGLQVTAHRRPVATGRDIGAMSMVKLGSGCNLLGYYMYHGGTNPDGRLSTLQESKATGYPNDLLVKSYDFNAPLKEYGQFTDTYRQIRRLALFVHDYQDRICKMQYIPQPDNPEKPSDLCSLRSAVRADKTNGQAEGFFFVNNYQRHYAMRDRKNLILSAYDESGKVIVSYPEQDVRDGEYFFYPFHMPVGNGCIRSCAATPLCILHGAGESGADAYVFYTDQRPQYDFEKKPDDGTVIITLTDEQALHASGIVINGREHLVISAGEPVPDGNGGYDLISKVRDTESAEFAVWPEITHCSDSFLQKRKAAPAREIISYDDFAVYAADRCQNRTTCTVTEEAGKTEPQAKAYHLKAEHLDPAAEEVMLNIVYEGNTAGMYINGHLEADSFYTGQIWEIGLKRFLQKESQEMLEVDMKITELRKDAKLYLEKWPESEADTYCRIREVYTESIYRTKIF